MLLDEDAVFPNGVIGVAGPASDRKLLGMFAGATVSSVGRYWHFMTSASWGVERDFVEENEYKSLPLPVPNDEEWRVLELLFRQAGHRVDEHLLSDLDELIFGIYKLSDVERARINRRLGQDLERFNRSRSYLDVVSDQELSEYGNNVCNVLGRTLTSLNVSGDFYKEGPYRCVVIALDKPGLDASRRSSGGVRRVDIDQILKRYEQRPPRTRAIVAQPTGLYVDEDTVYIVKTADRDRWSFDTALDDADRILAELAFGL